MDAPWATDPAPSARIPQKATVQFGGSMPGYSGFIPGKKNNDATTGIRFAAATKLATSTLEAEASGLQPRSPRMPQKSVTTTPPGYMGYKRGQLLRGPDGPSNAEKGLKQSFLKDAVPGYKGRIPGKYADNVIGGTYHKANQKAIDDFVNKNAADERNNWTRVDGPGVQPRRATFAGPGISIPGYSGFVPGKTVEGICGMTFSMANQASNYQRKQEKAEYMNSYGGSTARSPRDTSAASPGAFSQDLPVTTFRSNGAVDPGEHERVARDIKAVDARSAENTARSALKFKDDESRSSRSYVSSSRRSGYSGRI